jgi:hypothetical protein
MSEFKLQKYALMCKRLAAECRGLAADVPDSDLRAHFLHMASMDGTGGSTACLALVDSASTTWTFLTFIMELFITFYSTPLASTALWLS